MALQGLRHRGGPLAGAKCLLPEIVNSPRSQTRVDAAELPSPSLPGASLELQTVP